MTGLRHVILSAAKNPSPLLANHRLILLSTVDGMYARMHLSTLAIHYFIVLIRRRSVLWKLH